MVSNKITAAWSGNGTSIRNDSNHVARNRTKTAFGGPSAFDPFFTNNLQYEINWQSPQLTGMWFYVDSTVRICIDQLIVSSILHNIYMK